MTGGYVVWQFVLAPVWILQLAWNVQHALVRYFSVPVMIRTLFSHWHKDAVAYKGGLGGIALAFAWNQISRAIGFIIRVIVLALWLLTATASLVISGILWITFIAWPFIVLAFILQGILLLMSGAV